MLFTKRMVLSLAAVALLALCWPVARAHAGPHDIDATARETLDRFFYEVPSSRELANKATGILVFPTVVKAGFGFGGEYGEGALFIHGRTAGYYNDVSGSFGFQFGAQARSVIIMFMTQEALELILPTGWLEGWRGRLRDRRCCGRWRRHRYQYHPQPGCGLRLRSEGADVQSHARGFED